MLDLTSMRMSTSKLPTFVKKGWPALTVPATLMSPSAFTAPLNLLFLVPKDTVMEVKTSLRKSSESLNSETAVLRGNAKI